MPLDTDALMTVVTPVQQMGADGPTINTVNTVYIILTRVSMILGTMFLFSVYEKLQPNKTTLQQKLWIKNHTQYILSHTSDMITAAEYNCCKQKHR